MKRTTTVFRITGIFLIFGILFCLTHITQANTLDKLILMTENYPPFNFEEDARLQGIAVDLLVRMLDNADSKLTREDIKLLSWARAYKMVQDVEYACLFSTTRIEDRETLFKWVGPIATTRIVLLARKDRDIQVNSIADLEKYRIGVVLHDIGEQLLLDAGISEEHLERDSHVDAINRIIQKLNFGRFDLWAYEERVAAWELRRQGINPDEFESVYVLKEAELYFAFHRMIPDMVIETLQQALDALKANGEYQKILDRYGK